MNANPDIVEKILKGNDRPIMSLVGKVMRDVNRRGDPVVVKKMIEELVYSKKASAKTMPVAKETKEEDGDK